MCRMILIARDFALFLIFLSLISLWECSHMIEESDSYCPVAGQDDNAKQDCSNIVSVKRYLLYDVNPVEGFNLRRDVFMRVAVLTKMLRKFGDWNLVLPPWSALYHWKSSDAGDQFNLPWGMFFDVESIGKYVPVVEFHDFLKSHENEIIDEVHVLQHYKDAFKNNDWKDKMDIEPCREQLQYWLTSEGLFEGDFWGNGDVVSAKKVQCVSFQGPASYIIPLLIGGKKIGKKGWVMEPGPNPPRSVMVDRAEILLHNEFGSAEYWRARRSMRFASPLVLEAAKFRRLHLNSSDEEDGTFRPDDWRDEKSVGHGEDGGKVTANRFSIGGPYLSVHLRRQDFLWGRSSDVPTLKWAAEQVVDHLKVLNLFSVFIATDAPEAEMDEFRRYVGPNYNVVQWKPNKALKKLFKDGGVAIIEQIICSYARYFIGTHESTYSFRVQEEREIMGFHPDSTFNSLCGGDGSSTDSSNKKETKSNCHRPSRWRIVF